MPAGPAFQVALRAALCAGATALLWWLFGPFGLVFSAPLWGVLLARPLIDLAADLKHGAKALALDDVAGSFYAHKGRPVHVVEDDEGQRWLRAADLRKLVGGLPADASLAHLYPQGHRRLGRRQAVYLAAETVLEALARAQEPATLKLRQWVEREIALPAQRRRQREPG